MWYEQQLIYVERKPTFAYFRLYFPSNFPNHVDFSTEKGGEVYPFVQQPTISPTARR